LKYILATESNRRRRRQYNYVQQYSDQYGLYGPGGQGWVNNYNNMYPNPNFAWNNNFNWNHGTRYPEFYYNSSKIIQPSIFSFLLFWIIISFI
jgi:hypothetical protein